MKLYHCTKAKYLYSILTKGLFPNRRGCIYLTPSPEKWYPDGEWLLEVETENLYLGTLEGCEDWEVICKTRKPISPERLKLIERPIVST